MKYIGQMMVITSAILAGASLDGWAQDWFGFGGLCIRLAIFSGTFLLGVWLEHRPKRKKAKKKPLESASLQRLNATNI